jgi:hypothetical protein
MNWIINTIAGAYLLPKSSGVITVIIYMCSVHFFVGFNWWNVCTSRLDTLNVNNDNVKCTMPSCRFRICAAGSSRTENSLNVNSTKGKTTMPSCRHQKYEAEGPPPRVHIIMCTRPGG